MRVSDQGQPPKSGMNKATKIGIIVAVAAAIVVGLSLLSDLHIPTSELACARQIERYAKYDFKWDASKTFPKFVLAEAQPKNGVVYLGSGVKFQNGFGVWQRVYYRCSYNYDTSIASVTFRE